jgi:hypothetical protein
MKDKIEYVRSISSIVDCLVKVIDANGLPNKKYLIESGHRVFARPFSMGYSRLGTEQLVRLFSSAGLSHFWIVRTEFSYGDAITLFPVRANTAKPDITDMCSSDFVALEESMQLAVFNHNDDVSVIVGSRKMLELIGTDWKADKTEWEIAMSESLKRRAPHAYVNIIESGLKLFAEFELDSVIF